MSTEEMPPLPESPWRLHMPAAPYEPAWTSSSTGYADDDMRAYARAYAAQEVAKERDACAAACLSAVYGCLGSYTLRQVADLCVDAIRARGAA